MDQNGDVGFLSLGGYGTFFGFLHFFHSYYDKSLRWLVKYSLNFTCF